MGAQYKESQTEGMEGKNFVLQALQPAELTARIWARGEFWAQVGERNRES
jgi:hypothetical protein